MTTDIAVVERALVIMAIALGVQTLLFVSGAIAAFIAWRKASRAFEETKDSLSGEIAHLRAHADRIAGTVDEVVGTVRRGTAAVSDVVQDARQVLGSVGTTVGSVASVVNAPRAAMAFGVMSGVALWRRRRASRRLAAATTVQM